MLGIASFLVIGCFALMSGRRGKGAKPRTVRRSPEIAANAAPADDGEFACECIRGLGAHHGDLMPKDVLIDQLYVEIRAPTDLSEREVRLIRKAILKSSFRRKFKERVRGLLSTPSVPDALRVGVTR